MPNDSLMENLEYDISSAFKYVLFNVCNRESYCIWHKILIGEILMNLMNLK